MMPLPHHVPHHSEKSLVSLSFCRCPKSSISKPRHLHLPSASQLFPVIGSASIFRVQQPTSFTRHLCLCHRSLDTLTVTFTAPVWPFAPYNGPKPFLPPPHPFLSFHYFLVPHLCLLLVFQLLSPLCLLLLTLPWHEGRSSVKLPSSPPDVVSGGNNDVWPCADCLH